MTFLEDVKFAQDNEYVTYDEAKSLVRKELGLSETPEVPAALVEQPVPEVQAEPTV